MQRDILGWAMQANQAQRISFHCHRTELERDAPVPIPHSQSVVLDKDVVERAAQALFEFVFSSCGREKHRWTNCDESTKEGFRGEATAVIKTVWPLLFR